MTTYIEYLVTMKTYQQHNIFFPTTWSISLPVKYNLPLVYYNQKSLLLYLHYFNATLLEESVKNGPRFSPFEFENQINIDNLI